MLSVHVMFHHKHGSTEIARMTIQNDCTGSRARGNYRCETLVRSDEDEDFRTIDQGSVQGYARQSLPVWYLVMCALKACGYIVPSTVSFGDPPAARAHRK